MNSGFRDDQGWTIGRRVVLSMQGLECVVQLDYWPGSSGFRREILGFINEKFSDSQDHATIKKPARRPVEEEIKRAENKKHY